MQSSHNDIDVIDESLSDQWQVFENTISTLILAHTACRETNNIMDRALRISAMACSFATTTLITLNESNEGMSTISGERAVAECVMSGVVTLFASLINMYDNGGQRQRHQNHVDKYRSLHEKIQLARHHPRRSGQRSLYEKLKKRQIKIQSSGLSLFSHIRARYQIE
jgi:hypothetical protein